MKPTLRMGGVLWPATATAVALVAVIIVDSTDRALKEDVAGEKRLLVADRVGDVAGTVAGGEEHVEGEARQLERLAPFDHLVSLVALVGAEARERKGHDVGEHRDLDLGDVDRRPGGAR